MSLPCRVRPKCPTFPQMLQVLSLAGQDLPSVCWPEEQLGHRGFFTASWDCLLREGAGAVSYVARDRRTPSQAAASEVMSVREGFRRRRNFSRNRSSEHPPTMRKTRRSSVDNEFRSASLASSWSCVQKSSNLCPGVWAYRKNRSRRTYSGYVSSNFFWSTAKQLPTAPNMGVVELVANLTIEANSRSRLFSKKACCSGTVHKSSFDRL